MNQRSHSGTPVRRHRRAAIAAALLALALLALAAPKAAAGTYRAVQCSERLGAGHADAEYRSTSGHYVHSADCDGRGLGVEHAASRKRTAAGRMGQWTIAAPVGAAIVRAAATVSAAGADSHAPQLLVALADGPSRAIGGVRGARRAVAWSGSAGRALTARLACTHRRSCGPGRRAHVHLHRVALTLRDIVPPAVRASGELVAPEAQRGLRSLEIDARDSGSGVRNVTVELNDHPLAIRAFDCRVAGGVALRLRPCPIGASPRFELETRSGRFRQGPNRLRICASDFAPRAKGNPACIARTVRVDNLCPLSMVPGARLAARFQGAGPALSTRSDRPATVTGRLLDAFGRPLAGARICVAARPRGTGAAERVLTTPTTDARGAFSARVPAGPSRAIRIAHWPDARGALERHLSLRSRAVPRLRLRPRRTLLNGERIHFRVELPPPANGRRRVAVQARAEGRWIQVAAGRTSEHGTWRGDYRFRATTGTRRYAFRAVVRRQAGYPYAAGRSRVAHAKVVGRTAAKSKPG